MEKKERAARSLYILSKEFSYDLSNPARFLALESHDALSLLVATMLSAQCTDERVNQTTRSLFKKYKTASDYANASLPELEADLSSINFFRNKTKNVIAAAKVIEGSFGGQVPDSLEELTGLPGIGRKTANVILANAFGKDALAVDTHVKRVATRLGLAVATDPDKIEAELTAIIDKRWWGGTTHLFILHGRRTCKARKPLCGECGLRELCPYYPENSA